MTNMANLFEERYAIIEKKERHAAEAERLLGISDPSATAIARANTHALMAAFYQEEIAVLTKVLTDG